MCFMHAVPVYGNEWKHVDLFLKQSRECDIAQVGEIESIASPPVNRMGVNRELGGPMVSSTN